MIDIASLFGWIGSIAYAFCALPQTIFIIRKGSANGFQLSYVLLAFTGSFLSFLYAAHTNSFILFLNFGLNIVLWSIILKYKLRPRV